MSKEDKKQTVMVKYNGQNRIAMNLGKGLIRTVVSGHNELDKAEWDKMCKDPTIKGHIKSGMLEMSDTRTSAQKAAAKKAKKPASKKPTKKSAKKKSKKN